MSGTQKSPGHKTGACSNSLNSAMAEAEALRVQAERTRRLAESAAKPTPLRGAA